MGSTHRVTRIMKSQTNSGQLTLCKVHRFRTSEHRLSGTVILRNSRRTLTY